MPFGKDLPVAALSRHRSFQEAAARVSWAVAQRQVAVLTGEVGSGKTVAVRAALASLEPARHLPVYIPDPTITIRGIHTQVTTALGGEPQFHTGMLATQTAKLLAGELDERGRLPVVVVDEAHLLANRELEALRMLTNADMDAASTFALILVGQPTLRRRLKLAVLAALDQRIGVRYQMAPMDPQETTAYVKAHLAQAGRAELLFADDALAEIWQASRGWPRAVNNLAVAAMVAAYASGKALVDKQSAQAAAAEAAD
jgi:type II secretory pathway predicted ATPase ExeA